MSRARARKQEEKVEFLQSNPGAIEQETKLTVEKIGGEFTVVVTGEAELDSYSDIDFTNNKITLLHDLDTTDSDFDVYSDASPVHPPEGGFGGGEDFFSLSNKGFGVMGEDEFLGEDEGGFDVPRAAKAINDGETLNFELEVFEKKKAKGEGDEEVESSFLDYSEADDGGTATNIKFEVLNNQSGTVTLEIYGEDEGGLIVVKTVEIGDGQKGVMEDIGHVMAPNTTFDEWEFSVEGDVQVAITEIGYSTNYDSGALFEDT